MTTFKILNKTTFTMRLATLTTCRLDEKWERVLGLRPDRSHLN